MTAHRAAARVLPERCQLQGSDRQAEQEHICARGRGPVQHDAAQQQQQHHDRQDVPALQLQPTGDRITK